VPVAARTGSQLGPAIRFQPVPAYSTPITDQMDDIRLGVVTLSAGNSHGSGFFISPRLILTNHHVVAGRNVIRVTLLTGRSFLGEVVRTHPARDIALVSVESGGHRPLPLRTAPLKVGDNVYAIGTPLMQQLSGTVTRGIVSAFRTSAKGFEDIQADVDIHGGNSGGPLLDDKGNVVGVTYAGHGGAETSVGLNLFIPINDALRMLNLAPDDPVTGRPTAGR
jgi:serine protease Do